MRIKHNIQIPEDIILIHSIFSTVNAELYLVGGCVRDSLLNIIPKDFDLVTNIIPDNIIELLKDEPFVTNIIETGKSFGVINVITADGEYELATMREDVGSDGRRPDSVVFTNIETDCLRRDLTCNALYYDISTQEIIDLVGGVEDIKNKVVKAVGNPKDRFEEDKLRKLRCVRFAARFGSELSTETHKALIEDSNLIGISGERIRDEFIKGVKSALSVPKFISLLSRYNLLGCLFDDLIIFTARQNKIHVGDDDYIVTIAQLLSYNGPKIIPKRLNNLKYTSDEIKAITFLISLKSLNIDTAITLKRQQKNSNVTDDQIRKICKFHDTISEDIIETFINFNLTIDGVDLMAKFNLESGPELGQKIQEIETENFKNQYLCNQTK